MLNADKLAALETRRAVREFLARELDHLSGDPARPPLPADLAGLAAGSDREVIESCRLLDKGYSGRGAAESAGAAIGDRLRELFSRALQRMKQLPPDPLEPVRALTPQAAEAALVPHVRRKQV
jgi:hypothetical protein